MSISITKSSYANVLFDNDYRSRVYFTACIIFRRYLSHIHIYFNITSDKVSRGNSFIFANCRAVKYRKSSVNKFFTMVLWCTSGFCRESTNYPAAARAGRTHRGLIYKELAHTLARPAIRTASYVQNAFSRYGGVHFVLALRKEELSDMFH